MSPIETPQHIEEVATLEDVAAQFSKAKIGREPYAAKLYVEHPAYGKFEVAVRTVAGEHYVAFRSTAGNKAHMTKAGFLSRVMNPVTDALGLHRAGSISVAGRRTVEVTDAPAFYEIEVKQFDTQADG